MRAFYVYMLLILAAFVIAVGSAEASVEGPCEASIAGADLKTTDKVSVKPGDVIAYSFSAPSSIKSYSMVLSIGMTDATVSEGTTTSETTAISGEAELGNYTKYGVGLYKVTGHVVLNSGEVCDGTILVDVEGDPMSTAAGQAAAAVSGASTIALVLLFLKDAGFLFGGA